MAQTLDGQLVSINLANMINNPQALQAPVSAAMAIASSFGWASGVGAGQADRVYAAQVTIPASGSTSLDLAGTLFDAVGTALTFVRVRLIYVAALAANANNVIVGGVANGLAAGPILPQTTGQVVVRPGGLFLVVAPDSIGYTVTAATGDLLQLANSAGVSSVTANVVVIGASA